MAALDRFKIQRLKAEFIDARARSQDLLQESNRLLQEYRQTVERSLQLLEQSHYLIARAKTDRLLNGKACLIELLPLFGQFLPYGA